jgi:hypothetical protein
MCLLRGWIALAVLTNVAAVVGGPEWAWASHSAWCALAAGFCTVDQWRRRHFRILLRHQGRLKIRHTGEQRYDKLVAYKLSADHNLTTTRCNQPIYPRTGLNKFLVEVFEGQKVRIERHQKLCGTTKHQENQAQQTIHQLLQEFSPSMCFLKFFQICLNEFVPLHTVYAFMQFMRFKR